MNRPTDYFRFWVTWTLTFLILPGIAGCSYLSIPAKDDVVSGASILKRKNSSPVYNSAVIKGSVIAADNGKDATPTLVIAHRLADGNKIFTEYATTNSRGAFMLYLPEGRYHLYTVTDYNQNGIYERDEVSGLYGQELVPKEIAVLEGELITDVAIRRNRITGSKIDFPLNETFQEKQDFIKQATYNGQILKIYHEYFSMENAQTGYWNPSSFMKAFGAHIYLGEEYSPRKIPVLFVHGTEGSPQNWIYFCMRLDRSRYQPWFFYYPSGIRLTLAADLLNEELDELYKKYGFQKMVIAAHSVGGLTTRSFLTRYVTGKQNNFIKLFFTFATPWSGFSAADASQVMIHKSIPVWVDLGTQSSFIKTTMKDKLPPAVNHFIFYGKNDKLCGDKAIDERAVSCAVKTFGFDCTHDTILSDRKVFFQFNEIMDKELPRSKISEP